VLPTTAGEYAKASEADDTVAAAHLAVQHCLEGARSSQASRCCAGCDDPALLLGARGLPKLGKDRRVRQSWLGSVACFTPQAVHLTCIAPQRFCCTSLIGARARTHTCAHLHFHTRAHSRTRTNAYTAALLREEHRERSGICRAPIAAMTHLMFRKVIECGYGWVYGWVDVGGVGARACVSKRSCRYRTESASA
jgi:hypothetical protein